MSNIDLLMLISISLIFWLQVVGLCSPFVITEYKFFETECTNKKFLDTSSASFQIGNLTYDGPCPLSNGILGAATSIDAVPLTWSRQVSSGLSLEFWIQINASSVNQPALMLEFAASTSSSCPVLQIEVSRSNLGSTNLAMLVSICNAALTRQTFVFSFPKPQVRLQLLII